MNDSNSLERLPEMVGNMQRDIMQNKESTDKIVVSLNVVRMDWKESRVQKIQYKMFMLGGKLNIWKIQKGMLTVGKKAKQVEEGKEQMGKCMERIG